MPNHVLTNIRVTSSPKEDGDYDWYDETAFNEVCKKMQSKQKNPKGSSHSFDFNQLIPIPKELEETLVGTMAVVPNEDYELVHTKQLKEKQEQEKQEFNTFAGFSISESMAKEYKDKFGSCNWYEWKIQNWGTKWNAYDVVIGEYPSDGITFQTAWHHPEIIIDALSRHFPEYTFSIMYADEDIGCNCGAYIIKNGCKSDLEDSRFNAKRFATALWHKPEPIK